jgi:hypothetical protein
MGFRGAYRLALVAALLGHSAVEASSAGITGVSASPGCGSCHGGGAYAYSLDISGSPTTVAPSAANVAFAVVYTGSGAVRGGFNLAVEGLAGTLGTGDAEVLISGDEATHNGKTTPDGGGDFNWSFNWDAPATVGIYTFSVCANPVNNDLGTTGDGPIDCRTEDVTVNTTPNSTADAFSVLEGSSNNTLDVIADDTSGSSVDESGDTHEVTHINGAVVTSICPTTVAVTNGTVCRSSTNPNNTLSFTPSGSNFSGAASFTYQITDSLGAISTADTVSITVTDVNDAPTLTLISDPAAINEDAGQQTINLSGIGDGSTFESQTLTVTASSSNTAVIPNPTVTYTSPNATGSIAYTPVANASGSAIITVTVTDSGGTANGGDNNFSDTFTVTVNSVNDEPTLTPVADPAAINEDATQQTVNLSGIGAGGGESQTLTVTATSNNTALIPNPTVTYTSANATGSLAYTPVTNANGSAIITVTVTDSGGTANGGDNAVSDTFTVAVNAVNDAPVAVNDTPSVSKNSTNNSLDPLANDTDVDAGDTRTITIVGTPSAGGSVSIVGAGANNTLNYTPATNFSGNETISYTMRDTAMVTSAATITVTVGSGVAPVAVDDSTTVLEDSSGNVINVLTNDTDADAGDTREIIQVNGSASFPVDVGSGSVSLSATGPDNTLLYTPDADSFAGDTFTYTVRDAGLLTDIGSVTVTVTAINDAPTLNAIANPSAINEDATQQTVNLAGIGAGPGGESQTLIVSASSDNTGLIPNPTVTYTSPGATGSLAYTPVANASGSATVTVTVSDSGGTANGGVDTFQRTFTVTVNSVNDAPTLNTIANPSAIAEDAGQQTVNLAGIGAGGGESQTLTVTASSGNTALIPNPTVTYTSANATGSLAYTPVADANGSAVVTVTVTDNGGTANGGVNTFQRTFTVNVNAANDAPDVAAISDQSVGDNQPFSQQVVVTDVDGETTFTYSLVGAPAGMGISGSGLITWTPPIGTSGVFSITAEAQDAALAMGSASFDLTVTALDSDGDGMPDSYEDLYPGVLDKNDPTDANEDPDGDGLTNLEEYTAGQLDPTIDDVAPVLNEPADLIVPATGYLTVVDLGAATATDGKDGAVTPVTDWTFPVVRPGRYVVNWSATDQAGNVAAAVQNVDVLPLVDLSGLPYAAEAIQGIGGSQGVVVARLNGDAPEYPVTISFTLSGTADASDTDIATGVFTIAAGTSDTIVFNPVADGLAEGNETLTLTLTGATGAALGLQTSYTVTISEGSVPPVVSIGGGQAGLARLTAYQADGLYDLTANAIPSGPGHAVSYDWSASDSALGLGAAVGPVAVFDPSGVAPGTYTVRVTVETNAGTATATLLLLVAAGSSAVADVDADGVPDDVDLIVDYPSVLPDQTGDLGSSAHLETERSFTLRRGRTSLAASRTGALIAMSDIVTFGIGAGGLPLGADSFDNLGGIFDFEIHGVAPGGNASVVLPLQTAIREGAVYRKFDPATGWHDFVEDADNAVTSAFSAFGQCPGPASDEYVDGLQPFADCVRLTLSDGGPNDADGVADGVIRDPGGVAVATTAADDGGSSVSGGAFLAFWLLLAAVLRLRRSAAAALLALGALLAAAPAQAEHHVRIHYSGDMAGGFDDNVTTAMNDADIRESGFANAGGNVDYFRQLNLFTTLQLRGSLQGEYWNSFDGLNNGKATAMARLMYRANGDFFTPTLAAWLSASVWEFDTAIRDSNEYRAGAYALEQLTTQITGRFQLMANVRQSDGEVFDLSGYSASLNVDWVPAPRSTVYAGYQYYTGGVTSTATPSLWIGLAAEAIEPDDAFGGLAGGLMAYRLDATAQIFTLGYNFALTRKLSVDAQGLYVTTDADFGIEYEKMISAISLLARF